MSSKPTKVVFKRLKLKDAEYVWHEESTLVFKSAKERVVIGRYCDNHIINLDDKTLDLCDEYGFNCDPSLVDEVHNEEINSFSKVELNGFVYNLHEATNLLLFETKVIGMYNLETLSISKLSVSEVDLADKYGFELADNCKEVTLETDNSIKTVFYNSVNNLFTYYNNELTYKDDQISKLNLELNLTKTELETLKIKLNDIKNTFFKF